MQPNPTWVENFGKKPPIWQFALVVLCLAPALLCLFFSLRSDATSTGHLLILSAVLSAAGFLLMWRLYHNTGRSGWLVAGMATLWMTMLEGPLQRLYGGILISRGTVAATTPLIVFGFLVLIWLFCHLMAWRVHRRRMQLAGSGRCLACAYDLRASKARCPECGWIILPKIKCHRCGLESYTFLPECPKCNLALKGERIEPESPP